MATMASQVVFHPLVSQSLKFGGTTAGRDKAYRAVQYLARFLAWYALLKGNKEEGARWSALKAHLGTARKLLRLGKPVEHLQAALRASLASGPAGEQITTIARQLCYFSFLTYDALVWANTIKLLNLQKESASKVAKLANRFWLAGITFSIINGIIKLRRFARESKHLEAGDPRSEKAVGQEADRLSKLNSLIASRMAARRQFVIDLLDLWIPASALEIASVNEGALGILGVISSIMGGSVQWEAVNGKM